MLNLPLRVLVVEDETPLARLIAVNLERMGLQVTAVDGVASARAALDAESPDLLVLDSTLPDGDALEIWEEWQRREPGESAGRPGIVLAPTPGQQESLEARNEPWARVVGKPFSPPELVMLALTLLVEAGVGQPFPRLASSPPQKVGVDLCCGSGLSTCRAAQEAGPEVWVVGVDRSFPTVREAQRRMCLLGFPNTGFVVADVESLPFAQASVESVFGTENFPCLGLPDEGRAWAEVERVRRV